MSNDLALTTANRLSTLRQEISDLTERLSLKASDDAITARVLFLKRSGMKLPGDVDAEKIDRIYGFALKGCTADGLKTVTERLVQGGYPDLNPAFIPTPAELARLVRAEDTKAATARARAVEMVEAMKPDAPASAKVDDAARARIRAMVAGVKMAAKEARENSGRGAIPEAPITAEEADRISKILALPDAPNVTAEHMAARRRAEAKIENADPPHIEPVQGAYFKALQQQEEMENDGKDQAQGGSEGEDRGDPLRGPEGQQERDAGDGEFRGGEREDD